MRLILAIAAAGLTVAPAFAARQSPDELLAGATKGRTAGAPVPCISLRSAPRTTIVDEQTIVYRGGPITYVNRLPQACPGLREDKALISRTPSDRLCSGDIVTAADLVIGTTWGSCTLGEFVPYRRK